MTKLAPIILFVYNRPMHTLKTIQALKKNILAKNSELVVYSDGPKNVNDFDENLKIKKVREIVANIGGFKNTKVIEKNINCGLAKSIISGVTEVINEFGKVIVLEDDIITSPGFLKYMNEALEFYQNHENVKHISGYMFPVKRKLPETFFFNTTSCWGWGTWSRAWEELNLNSTEIIKTLVNQNLVEKFNLDGSYNYYGQLIDNHEKKINTWAVFWYATIFLNNGYCLHPYPSLTNNIGNDKSGINSQNTTVFNWKKLSQNIAVKQISIKESKLAFQAVREFYQKNRTKHIINNIKDFIYLSLSETSVKKIKSYYSKKLRLEFNELQRLKRINRFTAFSTSILGKSTQGIDSSSFIFMHNEIFNNDVYGFNSSEEYPLIIDCGANIGLSIIYFKKKYPKAKIVAFEPDPEIFKVLSRNIEDHKLSEVHLINSALWSSEGEMSFDSEGADSGKLAANATTLRVKTEVLSSYMDQQIDYLKMDIEGAEFEVIKECKNKLKNVKQLFIEFHSFENKPQELHEILDLLARNNFRYYLSTPGLSSNNPLTNTNTYAGMDMQVNIFAKNLR